MPATTATRRAIVGTALPVVLLGAFLLPGCGRSTLAPDRTLNPDAAAYRFWGLDADAAWSPSGEWIAFRRNFPTHAGPPGIYLMSSVGGFPRFIVPAGFWMEPIRFSPDDRRIVAAEGENLMIIDLVKRTSVTVVSSPSEVRYPDWSPDGATIAYLRLFHFPDAPPESAGVSFYSVATGADRPFTAGGEFVYLRRARFSPDGSQLAGVLPTPAGSALVAFDLSADSTRRVLVPAVSLATYEPLMWRVDPVSGQEELIYHRGGYKPGWYRFRYPDGPEEPVRVPHTLLGFSPGGRWALATRFDPVDSVGVVFRELFDSPAVGRLQLTRWD